MKPCHIACDNGGWDKTIFGAPDPFSRFANSMHMSAVFGSSALRLFTGDSQLGHGMQLFAMDVIPIDLAHCSQTIHLINCALCQQFPFAVQFHRYGSVGAGFCQRGNCIPVISTHNRTLSACALCWRCSRANDTKLCGQTNDRRVIDGLLDLALHI